MRCPKCERELPESVKYCVYCSNILFKECPSCKRKIGFDKRVCEFCGLDIAQYEQGKKLLEEGKKLEQNWKYEEAKAQYEEIQGLPVIAEEASKLLDAVLQKIKVINEQQFEGEKFLKTRLACAYRAFLKVQDLLPENEDIANKLEAIKVYGKKTAKKAIVCWGSTKGPAKEAAENLGIKMVQPVILEPFPEKQIKKALKGVEKLILVETNAIGQLEKVLNCYGIKINQKILKYNARPFLPEEIEEKIKL